LLWRGLLPGQDQLLREVSAADSSTSPRRKNPAGVLFGWLHLPRLNLP
jgi:hypothetical protein